MKVNGKHLFNKLKERLSDRCYTHRSFTAGDLESKYLLLGLETEIELLNKVISTMEWYFTPPFEEELLDIDIVLNKLTLLKDQTRVGEKLDPCHLNPHRLDLYNAILNIIKIVKEAKSVDTFLTDSSEIFK